MPEQNSADGRDKGLMLITSVRTGNTEVFLVDPVWGDSRNLTRTSHAENRYPQWSPDGKNIVFTSDRDGRDTFDLYTMDATGNSVKRLTTVEPGGVCYFPTWYGSTIYFGYAPPLGSEAMICRVSRDGTDRTLVAPGRDPAISPDGRSIAFTKLLKTGYCLFVMNASGADEKQLTTNENTIGAVAPTWSPDGTKVLYSDEAHGRLEIFMYDLKSQSHRQITSLGQFSASASWSPDMRQISFRVTDFDYWRYPDKRDQVYQEKRADRRPVWIADADGSNAHVPEPLRYHCAMDGSKAPWRPIS